MPSSACKTCGSEEHTSELQSHSHLVCRLLLEKKKKAQVHGHELAAWASASEWGLESVRAASVPESSDQASYRAHSQLPNVVFCFFFFKDTAPPEISPLSLHDALPINDTATTEIYTLSLHDALPISVVAVS